MVGWHVNGHDGDYNEAQRNPQQSRRAQAQDEGRPRLVLRPRQDVGPRREGREGAHRQRTCTASKAARCRCTCACPSAASTTSSRNDFAEVNLGPPAEGDRRQEARRRREDHRGIAAQGRPRRARAATASACWARASSRPSSTSKWPAPPARRSEAVKKAGGTLTTTFKKTVYMNKKGEPGKRQQRRAKAAEKRAARKAD